MICDKFTPLFLKDQDTQCTLGNPCGMHAALFSKNLMYLFELMIVFSIGGLNRQIAQDIVNLLTFCMYVIIKS